MKNKLHKLMALVLLVAGVQSANAYSIADLESGGWSKVESIADVDKYYYVFVDAKGSAYMMVDAHNREKAYYRDLSNPLLFKNSTWVLESNGDDSYALKNAVTSRYFNSGSAGWDNSLGATNQNANYKFALTNGKYDIQSVQTSQYLGPWNDNGSVAGYGERIAANKSQDRAPGFFVYAMERTQYNEKLATVFDQVTNDNPMDLTSKIENPCADLNIDGWTKENTISWKGNNGYDGKKGFFEFCNWGGAWTGKLTQTISSLPNGKYIVKVAAQAAATDVVLTIEANGVSQNLNCIGDKGGNISAEGAVVELGHGVAGWQYVSLECKVSNGELTISASSSATTAERWANVDNFTLTFLGGADESELATEEQRQAYNDALAKAEAYVIGFAAGEYAPYANVEALKTLEEAKRINVDESFAETVVAATTALESAVWTVNAEEMNAIYDGSFNHDYSAISGNVKPLGWNRTNGTNTGYEIRYLTNVPDGATSSKKGMFIKFTANYGKDAGYTMPLKANSTYSLSFVYTGWNNTPDATILIKDEKGNNMTITPASIKANADGQTDAANWQKYEGTFTTGEAANYVLYFDKDENHQLQIAFGDFKLYAVAAEEPEKDPNDYTSYIKNADLATADAWNTNGTKGISGGMVKVASESAFDFCQTITLPAGQYKMTAKAVYRYTGSEQDEYNEIQAGTETHLVKLYAETSSYTYEGDVMNRWEGASDTNLAGDGVSEVNGKFVPNSSNAVLAWFNADQYVNELVFNVQEEGAVKIGITRVGGIGGDYTNIGAWTLTRLGDAEADPKAEPEYLTVVGAKVGDVDIVEGAATVESISTIDITFDRPVALVKGAWATILDPWGGASPQAEVLADNNCVVRFTVDEYFVPFEYVLNIPAGLIVDAATGLFANAEIEVVITIEGGSDTPSASLNVTSVTVGEDEMADFSAISATTKDKINVNFDGMFWYQGDPKIVDADGNNALEFFEFGGEESGTSYFFKGMKAGVYTITLAKDAFLEYAMMYKAPAEDIVLTVQIVENEGGEGGEGDEGGEEEVEVTLSLNTTQTELTAVGATFQLVATVTPADMTVTWSSSSDEVATVDANGLVTAVGDGMAQITATVGDKSVTCYVIVTIEAEENPDTKINSIDADANAVIYDLSGRRVEKAVKGIYIINGRKVVIK